MTDQRDPRAAWEEWEPAWSSPRFLTIDAHTEGEPLRVILAGFSELNGRSILERRRDARERFDHLRTLLMWEPRGHADMYGCLIVPPVTDDAAFGVLFLHNEGFSTMCGHGIIAVTHVAIELGIVPKREHGTPVGIDTPAGFVSALAREDRDGVTTVSFRNVSSYVVALDQEVEVPGLGTVRYDLAFGGAYYAYVRAAQVDVGLEPKDHDELVRKGRAIKKAVMGAREIRHPVEEELGFLYGTIFVGEAHEPSHHSRNVCVFAEGEVDRCPTGTGVSGRLAIHRARGEIDVDQPIVIESILGTCFTGRVAGDVELAGLPAIVPEVEGRAFITGRHEFLLEPEDPLRRGFIFR